MPKFNVSEIQTVLVSVIIEAETEEEALEKFWANDFNETGLREECLESCNSKAEIIERREG